MSCSLKNGMLRLGRSGASGWLVEHAKMRSEKVGGVLKEKNMFGDSGDEVVCCWKKWLGTMSGQWAFGA